MPVNQQILLDNRPRAKPWPATSSWSPADTPALSEGQVLVRHHYLSLDPYMRGRMNDAKSYAQPQPLGQVMQGGTVGEVVKAATPSFRRGRQGGRIWAAGRNTAWSMPRSPACCARSTPPMCRCPTTWGRSACPA
jgi:NADPH-dependent curcumin reductase CurA